eukprot:g13784.t1
MQEDDQTFAELAAKELQVKVKKHAAPRAVVSFELWEARLSTGLFPAPFNQLLCKRSSPKASARGRKAKKNDVLLQYQLLSRQQLQLFNPLAAGWEPLLEGQPIDQSEPRQWAFKVTCKSSPADKASGHSAPRDSVSIESAERLLLNVSDLCWRVLPGLSAPWIAPEKVSDGRRKNLTRVTLQLEVGTRTTEVEGISLDRVGRRVYALRTGDEGSAKELVEGLGRAASHPSLRQAEVGGSARVSPPYVVCRVQAKEAYKMLILEPPARIINDLICISHFGLAVFSQSVCSKDSQAPQYTIHLCAPVTLVSALPVACQCEVRSSDRRRFGVALAAGDRSQLHCLVPDELELSLAVFGDGLWSAPKLLRPEEKVSIAVPVDASGKHYTHFQRLGIIADSQIKV